MEDLNWNQTCSAVIYTDTIVTTNNTLLLNCFSYLLSVPRPQRDLQAVGWNAAAESRQ